MLDWLDGKKTYIGAAVVGVSSGLAAAGVISADTASWLNLVGASVITIGVRAFLGKFIRR